MEEEKKIIGLLDQIPQPVFLVKENQIRQVNPAAGALLLAPGQAFLPLLQTGTGDYAHFTDGQLCLTLSIGDHSHSAVVIRMEDMDLVILDDAGISEELRSMALVSMQLRQPLAQALNHAQQLTAGSDDPNAAGMNRSLMQLLRLVSNMADISRYAASSRMELRDVDAFVLDLFEKAQALTDGTAVLSYEGLKQPVFSQIDPEQMERAIWNILSNSLKFLPQGGSIHGKLTRQGNLLRLTIQDSGSGIAEAVRSTLFRRYLRQPGIEDSRFGLGLGLSIVRTAAANHGGTVLIHSAPDGGTKVTMTFTLRQDTDSCLRSPLLRPDYTGGFDHGLVELAECLPSELYRKL